MRNSNRSYKKQSHRSGEDAFTRTEYEKMLNVCGSFREEILLKGGVAWGLRREDFVKVRIADIRETEMTHYEKKKDRIRTVPIGTKLSLLISKYLKTVPKSQKYLFGLSGSTAYRRLQDLCIQAEIPRRPFHALRATCVKFHQAEGWTPEQISELTGDTIRVLQEHYSVPSKAEMLEASNLKEVI